MKFAKELDRSEREKGDWEKWEKNRMEKFYFFFFTIPFPKIVCSIHWWREGWGKERQRNNSKSDSEFRRRPPNSKKLATEGNSKRQRSITMPNTGLGFAQRAVEYMLISFLVIIVFLFSFGLPLLGSSMRNPIYNWAAEPMNWENIDSISITGARDSI